ncbi:hypothetical protein [Chitinivibrio alkaliphilus]|nr:hypothetical protein [Chitinivibrio alkaliphilus]
MGFVFLGCGTRQRLESLQTDMEVIMEKEHNRDLLPRYMPDIIRLTESLSRIEQEPHINDSIYHHYAAIYDTAQMITEQFYGLSDSAVSDLHRNMSSVHQVLLSHIERLVEVQYDAARCGHTLKESMNRLNRAGYLIQTLPHDGSPSTDSLLNILSYTQEQQHLRITNAHQARYSLWAARQMSRISHVEDSLQNEGGQRPGISISNIHFSTQGFHRTENYRREAVLLLCGPIDLQYLDEKTRGVYIRIIEDMVSDMEEDEYYEFARRLDEITTRDMDYTGEW